MTARHIAIAVASAALTLAACTSDRADNAPRSRAADSPAAVAQTVKATTNNPCESGQPQVGLHNREGIKTCLDYRIGHALNPVESAPVMYDAACVQATPKRLSDGSTVHPYRLEGQDRITADRPLPSYNERDLAHCATLRPSPQDCAEAARRWPDVSPGSTRQLVILRSLGCPAPKATTGAAS